MAHYSMKAQHLHVNGTQMRISAGTFVTVPGNVLINNNAEISNSGTVRLAGDWTNNALGLAGGFPGTVEFNGTAAQTIQGTQSTTFYNFKINNSAGINLAVDADIAGGLSFVDGIITTGPQILHMTAPPQIPITGAGVSGYVNGNLAAIMPAGGNQFKFEVGNTVYAPVALSAAGAATAGELVVYTAPGAPPNENTPFANASLINQNAKVNQHWVLTPTGITTFFATLTFDFTNTLNTGNTASYVVRKYNSTTGWTTAASTVATSTITATGVNSYGEFEIGEMIPTGLAPGPNPDFAAPFPNPANDKINFQFASPMNTGVTISLFDATGKRIFSETTTIESNELYQVSTSGFAQGLYLILMEAPGTNPVTYKIQID